MRKAESEGGGGDKQKVNRMDFLLAGGLFQMLISTGHWEEYKSVCIIYDGNHHVRYIDYTVGSHHNNNHKTG